MRTRKTIDVGITVDPRFHDGIGSAKLLLVPSRSMMVSASAIALMMPYIEARRLYSKSVGMLAALDVAHSVPWTQSVWQRYGRRPNISASVAMVFGTRTWAPKKETSDTGQYMNLEPRRKMYGPTTSSFMETTPALLSMVLVQFVQFKVPPDSIRVGAKEQGGILSSVAIYSSGPRLELRRLKSSSVEGCKPAAVTTPILPRAEARETVIQPVIKA
jgi:hypothetical protein